MRNTDRNIYALTQRVTYKTLKLIMVTLEPTLIGPFDSDENLKERQKFRLGNVAD